MVMQGDPFADLKSLRTVSDANNGSRGLMAKNARWRHRAVLNFFDIRWTNAANGHFYQQFVRADSRDGNGFNAEVVRPAINRRTHCFGNRKHAGLFSRR